MKIPKISRCDTFILQQIELKITRCGTFILQQIELKITRQKKKKNEGTWNK